MYFRDGYKYTDDARRVSPAGQRDYLSSNGVTIYTAIYWRDRTSSCNCPGWSNRGKCKHAMDVIGFVGMQRIRHETAAELAVRTGPDAAPFVVVLQQPESPTRARRIKD